MKKAKKALSVFLSFLFILTFFSNSFYKTVHSEKLEGNEYISMGIAEEGIVLLKNDNSCLPFESHMKIGLYGEGQDSEYVVGGGGSGWVNTDIIVSPLFGLQISAFAGKLTSVETMTSPSQKGFDRVVYFVYRPSTEGTDRKATEGDYYLTSEEKNDISALVNAYPGKVTVVLNVAGIIDTTWLLNSGASSIVLLWLAGAYGGSALANVLTGQVTPSGKMVDTWAKDYTDYLSSKNFSDRINVYYREDIFVGYRQFETFDPTYSKVNFEFGYGLSYTDFDIKTNSVNVSDGYVNVNVTVKNTGTKYSGKEVVQVYYSAPDNILGNPAKELGAFAKTKNLAPGESETLFLSFAVDDMASYDDTGKIHKSAWILEQGQYKFYVGNSVKNAGQKGVAGTYNVKEHVIVEECFEYGTTIDERLLSNGTYEKFVNTFTPSGKKHTVSPYGYTYISAADFSATYNDTVCETHYHGTTVHSYLNKLDRSGSYLTYSLDVEKEGDYYLYLSLCDWTAKNNVCNVLVNGVDQKANYNVEGAIFSPFILSAPSKIHLPKGKVELKLVGNNMPLFSHMYISNNNISPIGKTVIEAESALPADGSLCISDALTITAGKTATYTLHAEKTGTYYISLNYTNTSNATDNQATITVNGKNSGSIGLSKTGFDPSLALESEKTDFISSESVAVWLEEGSNTVKLSLNNTLQGYIDSINVSTTDNGISFRNNTEEFIVPNLEGTILSTPINFDSLYDSLNDSDKQNDLLDEFISQLSIKEMANMASLYIKLDTAGTQTGGFGSTDADQLYFSGKYGLFSVTTADGPAGVRSNIGECFTYMPCISLLASTWNTSLIYEFGVAVGKEAAAADVKVWLAPGANIHRNPLCGRNFEYISEDPFLTGVVASQIINACQSQGVGCSLKHFAANNKEYNRHNSNSVVSERALREIYLKGFEIAIKRSNPVTVMTSYNLINGVPAECDSGLLREIARGEWGYEGLFISDWDNNTSHPVSLLNGNNVIDQNPNPADVVKAYVSGYLTRDDLEQNTKYILLSMARVYRESTKSILEGHTPMDLGTDFYASIKQTSTGLYVVDNANNVEAGETKQKWHFVRRANGSYTIISDSTGHCFDISGGNYSFGTNIQMYENNGSCAQQFYIYYIDGNYYFKTAYNDVLLDVDAATRNVQIWGNDTGINVDETAFKARSFKIIKESVDFVGMDLYLGNDFSCFIKNSSTGLFLTAEGDNAIFRNETKADNQKWIVSRTVKGGYTIKSVSTGKVLDVAGAATNHGTDINLWASNGTDAQIFKFIDDGNSKLYIKASYTNLFMDMDAQSHEIHACIYGNEASHKNAQLFEIIVDSRRDELNIKSDSALTLHNGYLSKVKADTSVSEILSAFENANVSIFNPKGEALQNGDFCTTGSKIVLHGNGIAFNSYEVAVTGDVDGNGTVDSTDYLRIKKMFLGEYVLEGAEFMAGDVDRNMIIDTTDYLKLKKAFLENSTLE